MATMGLRAIASQTLVKNISKPGVFYNSLGTNYFTEEVTASEIVDLYLSLQLADVYFAIGYYLRHKQEVDANLTEREQIAAEIRC